MATTPVKSSIGDEYADDERRNLTEFSSALALTEVAIGKLDARIRELKMQLEETQLMRQIRQTEAKRNLLKTKANTARSAITQVMDGIQKRQGRSSKDFTDMILDGIQLPEHAKPRRLK